MPYSLYSSKTKMPPFCVKHLRMWSKRTKNCENREHSTWNEAFQTISIKITFFWNVTSCSLVVTSVSKNLGVSISSSKEEATGHYKPSEPIFQTTCCHMPEHHNLNTSDATHHWEIDSCNYSISANTCFRSHHMIKYTHHAMVSSLFLLRLKHYLSKQATNVYGFSWWLLSLGFVHCAVVSTVWTFNH